MSTGVSSWSAGFVHGEGRGRARRVGGRLPIVPGTAGDHTAIGHFLTAVFQSPSRHEFKASLEDPFYEPHDRFLVKLGARIVGHARIVHRLMQFGPLQIPVGGLEWLAVSPEFRRQGYGRRLLAAAEAKMVADGALVGLARTRIPYFFRPAGWALCGRHSHSHADARSVLAVLVAEGWGSPHRRHRLNIRPWRRMELRSLVRIYDQNLPGTFGPLERTEAYWKWLIDRRAYDQFYVALDGPDLLEIEERNSPIIGYALIRAERIVELAHVPGHPTAAGQLLARACGDAIERGRQAIRLEAPPYSPLHEVFLAAGGVRQYQESARGEVLMARLLDPLGLLRAIAPELHRRAEAAGLHRPAELGLLVDGRKYRLVLTRQGVKAVSRSIGRSYLQLNVADFTRLLLGQLDWDKAVREKRLEVSTQIAAEAGRVLFPPLPLWRPPLDDLLSPEQPGR
jgi:GNAT superfamily N-acetyltransferase